MDIGIDFLLNLFNKFKIVYWLDSGTLLGLKREGELILEDKDIDISILDNNKILTLISKLKSYDIRIKKYKRKIVKIKIFGFNKRVIDISIFEDTGKNFFISPQFNLNDIHLLLKISFIKKMLLSFLYRSESLDYKFLLYIKLVRIGYWIIPKNLICVDQINKKNEHKYNFPLKANDYLTYRYGDWSKKISNWSSTKDDKGLYFF